MSKSFKNLIRDMPAKRQEQIRQKAETLKDQMVLSELRKALELTQGQLAETMHINQAAVSKFENQSDLYISTLRKILISMGAELKIIAQFPHANVEITQFNDISDAL